MHSLIRISVNRISGWNLIVVAGLSAGLAIGLGSASAAQPSDPVPSLDKPADALLQPAGEQPAEAFSTPKATPAKAEEPPASANQDPAAKEAFEQFAEAMKTLNSLTFDVAFSVEGNGKEMFGNASAKVVAKRTDKGWVYRMTGTSKRTPKIDGVDFDILYTDGNASWLEKDTKKLLVRPVSSARGKVLEAASNLRTLGDLFAASPLSKERAAGTIVLRDPEKAGEVECVVAVATIPAGGVGTLPGDVAFWFGKDDHLPRKIVRERSSARGTTSMVLELTEIKKDATLTDADLEIALPQGYTKDDQSASKQGTPSTTVPPPAKATIVDQDAPVVRPAAEALDQKVAPDAALVPNVSGEPAPPVVEVPRVDKDGVVTTPGTSPDATQKTTPDAVPAPAAPSADTDPVQAFEIKTADGATVTQETLRGQPAVVMFFGTWSLSSKKALPELKELAERYKDKAKMYAAAVRQRDPKAAVKMIAEAGLDIPVLVGADTLAEQWNVGGYPAVFVLGADGEFLKKPTGGGGAKASEMFAAARAALDAALGMAPAAAPDPQTDTAAPKPEDSAKDASK